MIGDAAPAPLPREGDRARRGAFAFVLVFAITVISLLIGYRYAIDTTANDGYLFQVARHTTVMLNLIGHEAGLEKNTGTGLNPEAARAVLRGEIPRQVPRMAVPAAAADAAPLTAWETWRYRALTNRRSGDPQREVGPRITFVLRPGLQHELEALEASYRKLQAANPGNVPVPAPAGVEPGAALKEDMAALRARMAASQGDPALRRERQGLSFTFIVIPECGAIEVMAIFLAAVLAFPAPWRSRAWGLLLGLPLMYLVNIVRLSCLACIGALDAEGAWFEFFHEYVWQTVYVIFVVLVWVAWVELGVRRRVR